MKSGPVVGENDVARIEAALDAVRKRLITGECSRIISRILLAGSTVALAWILGWRLLGYAAPHYGYVLISCVSLVAAGFWLRSARPSPRRAARIADAHFSLKDGIISWMDFRDAGLSGGVYLLNERDLARRVSHLDPSLISTQSRRKSFTLGTLLLLTALILSLLPDSPSVRNRIASETATADRTAEIERQVDEVIEEIIHAMSREERLLISPAAMREWAEGIKATTDMRECEMQLARLEQQVGAAIEGLESRQDEAILKLAAGKLAESSYTTVRQLGKKLDSKEFNEAAKDIREMKPQLVAKITPEELDTLRSKATMTRDMARRMADGARQRDFGKLEAHQDKDADSDDPLGMDEMLEKLDEDAGELAKDFEKVKDPGDDLEEIATRLGERMDGLGERLGKLAARRNAKNKLDALRRSLADARQFARGKSNILGLAKAVRSSQSGGREPGNGSDSTRREERNELKDNGNFAEVKGRPDGDGPSASAVESAESGGGTAGRANVARQREFKQQLESLVRRDDIPDSLKLGVREYFETIHDIGSDSD